MKHEAMNEVDRETYLQVLDVGPVLLESFCEDFLLGRIDVDRNALDLRE